MQYFFVDESGDAGLDGQASSSSHFVMAMVQLPERTPIELDIANEILVIDGATPAFCRDLRIEFTKQVKLEKRIRPFKNIIGADSEREDGLQLADMIAGALRVHTTNKSSRHFQMILPRIVDLWEVQ